MKIKKIENFSYISPNNISLCCAIQLGIFMIDCIKQWKIKLNHFYNCQIYNKSCQGSWNILILNHFNKQPNKLKMANLWFMPQSYPRS